MTRKEILEAAEKCVTGQREEDYGSPEDNFLTIANFWTTYISKACCDESFAFIEVGAQDVAVMMALLKIARIAQNPEHVDSWIDGCGYLACGGEVATGGNSGDISN